MRIEWRRWHEPHAVDVVAIDAFETEAPWNNGSVADEQVIKALLGVRDNHIAWINNVLFPIFTFVIFDTLMLVTAALKNRVEVMHGHAGVVVA